MTERLRQEILSLDAFFNVNGTTGRYELVVSGSGNTLEESRRALAWMKLAMFHPDWRLENTWPCYVSSLNHLVLLGRNAKAEKRNVRQMAPTTDSRAMCAL